MTEYNHFVFSGISFDPNVFRLRLFRALLNAWFAQNNFSTELNSPISAVHFPFATFFQYLNFFRFCSYSRLKFSYGCSLQWLQTVCQYLFSSSRNQEANFRDHLKEGSDFEQRERKYADTWGWWRPCAWLENTSKALLLYSFCIYNSLFPLLFHLYALPKLQMNCEFTILPFSTP